MAYVWMLQAIPIFLIIQITVSVKITPSGIISTIAGTGVPGYTGDGEAAIVAEIHNPAGLTADNDGNILFADLSNNVIRKISAAGVITTIAGNGTAGFGGDGGPAVGPTSELLHPTSVVIDASGNNIYVADAGNNRIRRIDLTGVIHTIAGTGGAAFGGDGGLAVNAQLNNPTGLFTKIVDGKPVFYIADANNEVIRYIDTAGIIGTIAGSGSSGHCGDGQAATTAQLNTPSDVFGDAAGNLYIADRGNSCIRKINTDSIITTYAGTGVAGYSGDGGSSTLALLNNVPSLYLDASANVYIPDYGNNRIRKVNNAYTVTRTQVGSMQREMTFTVQTCTYTAPTGGIDSVAGGTRVTPTDSTQVYACQYTGNMLITLNPTEADATLLISVTNSGLAPALRLQCLMTVPIILT